LKNFFADRRYSWTQNLWPCYSWHQNLWAKNIFQFFGARYSWHQNLWAFKNGGNMWTKIDGKDVWVDRKTVLMGRSKEELVEMVMDMESELRDRDEKEA
jgi:hypothetical protein